MKNTILMSLTLGVLLPASVHAAIPSCAQHLQEPGPDGRLTQEQIDANNACQTVVETQKKISEALAAISDNERRSKGAVVLPSSARSDLPQARMPFLPPQPSTALMQRPTPMASQEKAEEDSATASVDGVLWEGGTVLTGLLHMPDGQPIEAIKGTTLPDGSVVTAITQNGNVTVIRNGRKFSLPSTKPSQQSSPLGNPL